jgi:hypothetical protein
MVAFVNDQPVFEARYVEQRSRLSTFFRIILAIPHFIVLYVWGIVAFIAVVVAWFALLFTGRYPGGLYDFVAGYLRYSTAVYGYTALLTDEYPPFSSDTSNYSVQLRVPPPKAEYNRLKVLFRILLAIPVAIILYAMQIVWQIGALIAWFAIVILGKQPKGLQDMIVLGLSYQQRAYAYLFLITEDWPPFLDQPASLGQGGGGGPALPEAPERPGPAGAASSFSPPEAPPASVPPPAATPEDRGLTGGDPLRND